MEKEKLLCMIDAQNLYYTPKKTYKAQVDFEKLMERIREQTGQMPVDAYIYLVADAVISQVPFLSLLQKLGYRTRIKLMYFEEGAPKNTNWDDEMIEDARRLMPDYSGIILVSGDHGFIPLLNEWAAAGKSTHIYCFKEDVAAEIVHSIHATDFFGREVMYQRLGL